MSASSHEGGTVIPLVEHGSKVAERILAILVAIGGTLAGTLVAGALLFLSFIFSFGDSADSTDLAFAFGLGGAVTLYAWALAVLMYRRAGVRSQLVLDDDRLEVWYKAFSQPLVVPRSLIRVAMIDDSRSSPFTGNKRFPIAGDVPPGSFADALDNFPRAPWEDLDPDRRGRGPTPGVIIEDYGTGPRLPGGYGHDDPSRDGWASSGGAPAPTPPVRQAYLWSGDGSSLPFLRVGPGDVPNLAIIFHEPRRAPRPPWWFFISPLQRGYLFLGGRQVRGLFFRVERAEAAEEAFRAWGVARGVTAGDVTEEGLLVAKPLSGKRALLYGGAVVATMLAQLLFRHLR